MRRAEAIAEAEGLAIIPPFDHADIIAGQGTVGLEIVEDFGPEKLPQWILYPTGGGTGLIGMHKAFGELAEIGWWRPVLGLVLYAMFLGAHGWLFGVSP